MYNELIIELDIQISSVTLSLKQDVPRFGGQIRGHVADASQRQGPLFRAVVTAIPSIENWHNNFYIICIYKMQLSAYDYHVFHLLFDPEKDHVLKTEYDCIRKTNLCL